MNPEYQSLDPAGAPDSVTPADGPGDAAGYASVTPGGRGTAPYSITAPSDEAAIAAVFGAAMDLTGGQEGADTGAGIPNRDSPRQQAAAGLLNSPQGFSAGTGTSGYDIPQGWSGEPDESFPNNVQPSSIFETPIQGMGTYPGTVQDGVPKYGC